MEAIASTDDLELTQVPFARAEMLIRRPVAEVFEAFINPEITTKSWFTHSSGKKERSKGPGCLTARPFAALLLWPGQQIGPFIRHGWRRVGLESIKHRGGRFLAQQQIAVLGWQEAFFGGVGNHRQQRREEAADIQQANWLLMQANLCPGHHLEQIGRA